MITKFFRKLIRGRSSDKTEEVAAPQVQPEAEASPPQEKPTKRRRRNRSRRRRKPQPAWDTSMLDVPREEGKTRFYDLDLSESLLHAIYDLGFQYCSPIQAQILPHTLRSSDAIGQAQTGTGKTAAFLATIIDSVLKKPIKEKRRTGQVRALIIAPTRELVTQIGEDARGLCKYTDLHVVTLIGGTDFNKQQQKLKARPVDILIATPGRLIDFMTRKDVFLDQVEILVLDEADRMLDMGFIPQVKRILRATPETEDRQTLLFSATFSTDIINLSYRWTHNPVKIEIEPENMAADGVQQKVYLVSNEEKFDVLLDLLRDPGSTRAIVFANRRDQTLYLYNRIRKAGIKAGILSGEIHQKKRSSTLEDFKKGVFNVLVATDVAGRGIHVDDVSHVINYHLPENPENYVHRIGRTGRAGASGISISLACENEVFEIPAIEELLGYKLVCELPPQS